MTVPVGLVLSRRVGRRQALGCGTCYVRWLVVAVCTNKRAPTDHSYAASSPDVEMPCGAEQTSQTRRTQNRSHGAFRELFVHRTNERAKVEQFRELDNMIYTTAEPVDNTTVVVTILDCSFLCFVGLLADL